MAYRAHEVIAARSLQSAPRNMVGELRERDVRRDNSAPVRGALDCMHLIQCGAFYTLHQKRRRKEAFHGNHPALSP